MNRSCECRAVPFTEMLGLLFISLKLAEYIDWRLSPFVFSFIAYIDKEVKKEARRRETE